MISSRLVRHVFAILIVQCFPLLADADETEPTAEEMMVRAHEARAVWQDMPGFSADVEVSTNGKVIKGRLTVSANGELDLKLPDSMQLEWATRRIQSLVNHRLPRKDERKFNVSFSDGVQTHPLGRLIRFQDDRLRSVYRISDDVITEVHRTMGPARFTISMTDVSRNAEGKHLPQSYSVSWWDAKTGNLSATDMVRNEWVRVIRWDLPAKLLSVRTEDEGKREVGQIVFRNHQLLEKSADK